MVIKHVNRDDQFRDDPFLSDRGHGHAFAPRQERAYDDFLDLYAGRGRAFAPSEEAHTQINRNSLPPLIMEPARGMLLSELLRDIE